VSNAAAAHATLPVTAELLERLQYFRLEPRVIVDLGCGAGVGAGALRRRFPRARVVAIDLSLAMARQARRAQRFWRRYECICADACALPLAAQSVDLVFSSLMLQHCDDPAVPFAEAQRVLRPGGLLLFSTLGPATLQELRDAWAVADDCPHLRAFADMPQLAAAATHAGLAEPVMDRDLRVTHYAQVTDLMQELRTSGAGREPTAGRRRSLTGPGRWRQMAERYESLRSPAGIPASWDLIYGAAFAGATRHAQAPDANVRARNEAVVAIDTLRARRRSQA
jgi:malonyl-CoA O-methyltransferase